MIELLVRTSVQGNGQVLLNERVESGPWELYYNSRWLNISCKAYFIMNET